MANISMNLSATNLEEKIQIAAQENVEVRNKLGALHLNMIRKFAKVATAKYKASLNNDRRGESGMRASNDVVKGRMTGRFAPFGSVSGAGAFRGQTINDRTNHIYGWGYPNIDIADAWTSGIWRVLEYGLAGKDVDRDPDENAPRGIHLMPLTPRDSTGAPEGPFVPVSPAYVLGPGLKGKRFLRDTWEEIEPTMEGEWRRTFNNYIDEFNRRVNG